MTRKPVPGDAAPVAPAAMEQAGWRLSDEENPFIGHVGPLWVRRDADGLAFAILPDARHANRHGIVHGGMLMTLLDRAMGGTARDNDPGQRHATIQLDVHFIDGARIGEAIEARARVIRQTRTLIFIEGTLMAGSRVVATGKGVWRFFAPAAS